MRLASLCSLVILAASSYAYSAPIACIIYTLDGKGDKSFNDAAFEGVKKAKKDFGVEIKELYPKSVQDAEKKATDCAKEKIPLVISIGFVYTDTIKNAAKNNPQSHFSIIDSVAEGENVASFIFKEQEGSYLAGYLAGKLSKTGTIGFVGGMKIPPLERFLKGYKQGFLAANPKGTLLEDWIGNDENAWNNPTRAKVLAREQYSKGADIVYAVAGGSGFGVFDAAKETKKLAIGVDSNQNHLAPGFIVTSMLKRVDTAVYRVIKDEKEGKFKGGIYNLGIAEEGVDLAIDEHTKKLVDAKILKEVEDIKSKILSGKIKVE